MPWYLRYLNEHIHYPMKYFHVLYVTVPSSNARCSYYRLHLHMVVPKLILSHRAKYCRTGSIGWQCRSTLCPCSAESWQCHGYNWHTWLMIFFIGWHPYWFITVNTGCKGWNLYAYKMHITGLEHIMYFNTKSSIMNSCKSITKAVCVIWSIALQCAGPPRFFFSLGRIYAIPNTIRFPYYDGLVVIHYKSNT